MGMLIHDCPRCQAKQITFDVRGQAPIFGPDFDYFRVTEAFSVCRACDSPTIFKIRLKSAQDRHFYQDPQSVVVSHDLLSAFSIEEVVSLRNFSAGESPEHLPSDIAAAFAEAMICLSAGCYNAAAAMFRLCVDMATRPLLPSSTEKTVPQPNEKQRRDLGLRLAWLFDKEILPPALRELARSIREDANDGAHVGNLTEEDAQDIRDFTTSLLERLITEPRKLELAEERRRSRRQAPVPPQK